MARYSIEDTTLTALGDAIRERVGETRVETIPLERYKLDLDTTVEDFTINGWKQGFATYTREIFIPILNDTNSVVVKYSLNKAKSNLDYTSFQFYREDGVSIGSAIKLEQGTDVEQELELVRAWPNQKLRLYQNVYRDEIKSSPTNLTIEIIQYDSEGNEITTQEANVPNTLTPIGMAEAINNMPPLPPENAFIITGDCTYRFANGGWDWFVKLYGDKLTTKDIAGANYMFQNSTIESIPFDINLYTSSTTLPGTQKIFHGCSQLKELPKVIPLKKLPTPTSKYNFMNVEQMFYCCKNIKEVPEDYFDSMLEDADSYWAAREALKVDGKTSSFYGCQSLRRVSPRLYKPYMGYGTAYYYSLYNNLHYMNSILEEIVDLPVEPGPYTSNCFNGIVSNCHRLKKFTFETNEDGTPKTANWKGQTLYMGGTTNDVVGYAYNTAHKNNILNFNSGITADKEVKDNATYAALKNDPDWFATSESYSRYDKLSALETIATLPDCSASGGTNTIRFRGVSGGKTDGGAINTMTEAEIAVAAAKGWTVSFV